MIFVFYLLAAGLVFVSWKSLTGGIDYLRFFRERIDAGESDFRPMATVFVPCRGLDEGLGENLKSHFLHRYPSFELVFVVDSAEDPAASVINGLIAAHPGIAARLIVAGSAQGESQKVHNLRVATGFADESSAVFVFADSDVRPGPDWLASLVAPLADPEIGCATGYRWFISPKFGFASEMRSVWNSSIASALGPNRKGNFCWGGSMAVRRETFESVGIRDKWRGTLSDDFAMTRAMNDAGLGIEFVPSAMAASIESCGMRELLEFTTRQMKITRVYAPHLWRLSFIGSGLFSIVLGWATAIVFFADLTQPAWWIALATIAIVSMLSIGKAAIRLRAMELVLKPHTRALRRQRLTQCTMWVFAPLLFLYNCVCALVSRRIVWRGVHYRLVSPTRTEIVE